MSNDHFWTEPIKPGKWFRAYLNPWIAGRPDDVTDPRSTTRNSIVLWQKFERMLKYAREKEMIVSVIFWMERHQVHRLQKVSTSGVTSLRGGAIGSLRECDLGLGDDLDGFRPKLGRMTQEPCFTVWTHTIISPQAIPYTMSTRPGVAMVQHD